MPHLYNNNFLPTHSSCEYSKICCRENSILSQCFGRNTRSCNTQHLALLMRSHYLNGFVIPSKHQKKPQKPQLCVILYLWFQRRNLGQANGHWLAIVAGNNKQSYGSSANSGRFDALHFTVLVMMALHFARQCAWRILVFASVIISAIWINMRAYDNDSFVDSYFSENIVVPEQGNDLIARYIHDAKRTFLPLFNTI